jgi:hypothetical protein
MTNLGDSFYVIYQKLNNTTESYFNFLKSTDDGLTWSAPTQVNDSTIIDDRNYPGYARYYPNIAISPDGQRIYAAWADRRVNPSGNDYDVYFSYSLDGGQTWSPDIRVNEDTTGLNQLYPSMAVKSNGGLIQCWWSGMMIGK